MPILSINMFYLRIHYSSPLNVLPSTKNYKTHTHTHTHTHTRKRGTTFQEVRQSTETDPELNQMLELTGWNFKITVVNMLRI